MRNNFGSATRNTALVLTFCGVLLISGNAFGSGGTCPSGANYLNTASNSLVTLASLGVTSCYYIAANGNDSTNGGKSEAAPWLHAPFMPNCSGNCATLQSAMSGTAAAGLGFIFRGGDTWHLGNSGASPYVGGTWEFNSNPYPSGTSTNPIYIGVDPGWYSGSSWARPILNGDNPLCNSSLVNGSTCFQDTTNWWEQYYVSSCPYQVGSTNNFFDTSARAYYILDNFEMTGQCLSHTGQPYGEDVYVNYHQVNGTMKFLNLYIHGWTHLQFVGNVMSSNCATGVCWNQWAITGSPYSSTIPPEVMRYVVVDGADSDPVALGAGGAAYDVAFCAFRYTSNSMPGWMHAYHDNLYEYFFENGHGNVLENIGEWNGNNAFYNNVFRHLETSGGTNGWGVNIGPQPGYTDYVFNNLIYDEGAMNFVFGIGSGEGNGANVGQVNVFNNTMEHSGAIFVTCQPSSVYTDPVAFVNNHFITDNSTAWNSNCTSQITNNVTNLVMTHSTATADGYTTSETYPYSPTSGSSPTVGAGTNETSSYCATLLASSDPLIQAAGTACESGTTIACTYITSNHTMSCPAQTPVARPASSPPNWDSGAYQFASSTVAPPTGVTGTPH